MSALLEAVLVVVQCLGYLGIVAGLALLVVTSS